jgi:hypothetical protein
VNEEDILQIEFMAQVLLVPNLISKQVAIDCQAKYYLGKEPKTHKLYFGLHLFLKTLELFWVNKYDLLELEFIELHLIVPNPIIKQVGYSNN